MARALSRLIGLVTLLAVACSLGAGRHLGRQFADFDATDPISGKEFRLSEFRGKVVLIDFWATWCGPCVRELPNVKQAWNRYKDKGLVIVSISLDDNRGRFESFVKSNGMDWYHVMDGGGWNTRLAKKYGISSIPAMFIIDHEGVCVADSARGARLSKEIERALDAASDADAAPETGAEPAASTSGAAAMLPELTEARDELARATEPLKTLGTRLDAAADELTRLESQLAASSTPAAARVGFSRVLDDMASVRGAMFAIGLLNGTTIVLPDDPFADATLDLQRASIQAHQQIPAMQSAIDTMKKLRQRTWDTFGGLQQQLDESIQAAQQGGNASGDAQSLIEQAQATSARWSESWKAQLANVAKRGSELAGENEFSARLSDIATRLKAFRASSTPTSTTTGSPAETFGSICDDLADVANDMRQAGAAVDGVRLPKNPLDQRFANDRRARAELELNIKVAGSAITELTELSASLGGNNALFQQCLEQIRELDSEMKSGGLAAGSTATPRERFEQLCAQLLDALDA